MKAKKLEDLTEMEILGRLYSIENRCAKYPARKADIHFLIKLVRKLLDV